MQKKYFNRFRRLEEKIKQGKVIPECFNRESRAPDYRVAGATGENMSFFLLS
jgi:hypothetical protein